MGSPPRTVYILGAGASYGSRLVTRSDYTSANGDPSKLAVSAKKVPLTREFFAPFEAGEYDREIGKLSELVTYVVHQFGNRADVQKLNDVLRHNRRDGESQKLLQGVFAEFVARFESSGGLDIEDVFTRLQAEIDRHPIVSPELLRARDQLIRLIVAKLSDSCGGRYSLDYLKLVERITPNDSVITYNWDDLIDKAFTSPQGIRTDFVRSLAAVSPTDMSHTTWKGARVLQEDDFPSNWEARGYSLYLKLHGSVTWFSCLRPDCPGHNLVFHAPELTRHPSSSDSNELDGGRAIESYYKWSDSPSCPACGVSMPRVMIPPIMSKPYEAYPAVRKSWALAYHALEHADRIVSIGYSYREADVYSNWLLASSLRKRRLTAPSKATPVQIEVVDKDPAGPAKRIETIVGDWARVTPVELEFEEWTDQQ